MWSCDSGKVSPPPGKAQKRGGCPPPDYSTGFSAAFALCLGDLGRLSGRPRRSASPRQGGLSLSQGILARPTVCGLFIVTMHWDSKQCSDRYRSPEKHVCSKQWLCLPLNHNHIDAKLTCNITYALVKIIFYMEVNLKDSSDTGDPTNISLKGKLITAQNHFHSILMRCMTPTVIHDLVFKQLFEINNDNSMVWKEKQRPRISSRVITACPSMGTYSNSELSGISADFSGFVSFHDYFWYFYHRKWSEVAQSCLTLGDPMDYSPPGSSVGRYMGFSRQEYWSGLPFPFPGGSSWPRDRTQVSHIEGRCFYCLSHQGSLITENIPVNIHVLISLTHVLTLKRVLGLGRGAWCLMFSHVEDVLKAAAEGGLAVNDNCLRVRWNRSWLVRTFLSVCEGR